MISKDIREGMNNPLVSKPPASATKGGGLAGGLRELSGGTMYGWTIFNHLGSPWTIYLWPDREDAERYLEEQRAEWAAKRWGTLSQHSVQYVKAVVTPIAAPRSTTGDDT